MLYIHQLLLRAMADGWLAHLDLVNIDPFVLLLHRFIRLLHSVHCCHLELFRWIHVRSYDSFLNLNGYRKSTYRILQVLCRHRRLLHIPRLLLQLHKLTLVHPFLLECSKCSLLDCILVSQLLPHHRYSFSAAAPGISTHLSRSIPHLAHLSFEHP